MKFYHSSVPMLSLTSTHLEFHPWHFSHFWCISICFYHWLPSHLLCILVIHCTYFYAFCLEMGCVPVVSLESCWNPEDIRTNAFAEWVFDLKAIQNGKLFSSVPVQHWMLRLPDLIRTWLLHKNSSTISTPNRRIVQLVMHNT